MQRSSTNGSGKQQPRLPRLPSALPATLPTLPPTRPPCAWSWAWVAQRGRSGWPASHPATPWASAEGQEAGSSRGGGAGWRQLDVSGKCMGGRRNAEGVLGKKCPLPKPAFNNPPPTSGWLMPLSAQPPPSKPHFQHPRISTATTQAQDHHPTLPTCGWLMSLSSTIPLTNAVSSSRPPTLPSSCGSRKQGAGPRQGGRQKAALTETASNQHRCQHNQPAPPTLQTIQCKPTHPPTQPPTAP